MITLIHEFQEKGNSVVLLWDANEAASQESNESGVQRVLEECSLVDAHSLMHPTLTPPATHCNGSQQIDYIFISPELIPSVRSSCILKFHSGYTSDHRALVVDFHPEILFGKATTNIGKTPRRKLVSNNPRTMEKYIHHIRKAFQSNKIVERVQLLACNMLEDQRATKERIEEYHRLDNQITEIMLAAEAKSKKDPGGEYPWSPQYKEAQMLVRYWSLRLSQLRTKINNSESIEALAMALDHFPEVRTKELTRVQLEERVRRAIQKLRQVKQDAQEIREVFLKERAEFQGSLHRTHAEKALRGILLAESMSIK
jgi:hypothetical protein